MNQNEVEVRKVLRRVFKYFNRFMLLWWRLGLGRWMGSGPEILGRYMVIAHTGRKSGLIHQTPVNYAIVGGDVYCAAGFGKTSDWYLNLLSDPRVEVWMPEGWWEGVAEEVTDPQARMALMRQVIRASGFAGKAAGIDPSSMNDTELEQRTADYHLIRIHRTAARTGPGGPGEWAWVWPLATLVLLLSRRRRKHFR